MITPEMIRLFFTIAVFWIVLGKGQNNNCSLWVNDSIALKKMPLVYIFDKEQKPYILYPNTEERLEVEYNRNLVFSCISSHFVKEELQESNEVLVTCLGEGTLRFNRKNYNYADFECIHIPRASVNVTDRKCPPNNNTVIEVGFQTKHYFFPLYSVCFDTINKNALYSWNALRIPFHFKSQKNPRLRISTRKEVVFGDLDLELVYEKVVQQETVNRILKLDPHSAKYINFDAYFLTRGYLTSRTTFYFVREQSATFNYVNVSPRWRQLSSVWAEMEIAIKSELTRRSNARRVIVTGTYGACTLPDVHNKMQPLYLVMPEKQLAVPMYVWKLIYDADDERNNVVYIGLNNPYADARLVEETRPKCEKRTCPARIRHFSVSMVYCCTKESFERMYVGEFDPEVFSVPERQKKPVFV